MRVVALLLADAAARHAAYFVARGGGLPVLAQGDVVGVAGAGDAVASGAAEIAKNAVASVGAVPTGGGLSQPCFLKSNCVSVMVILRFLLIKNSRLAPAISVWAARIIGNPPPALRLLGPEAPGSAD